MEFGQKKFVKLIYLTSQIFYGLDFLNFLAHCEVVVKRLGFILQNYLETEVWFLIMHFFHCNTHVLHHQGHTSVITKLTTLMWFSEAKKHESCNVYDSNHAKMSNICRKIFFSDIGIADKKQEYTICRRKKNTYVVQNTFELLPMMFKSFSQYDWFLLRMRVICHVSFWIQTWSPKSVHDLPFLVPKILLYCWFGSGSVHYFFSKNKSSIMHCLPWHKLWSLKDRWIKFAALLLFSRHFDFCFSC